jgi:hypothetical protein
MEWSRKVVQAPSSTSCICTNGHAYVSSMLHACGLLMPAACGLMARHLGTLARRTGLQQSSTFSKVCSSTNISVN